jgi:hypothetical protein
MLVNRSPRPGMFFQDSNSHFVAELGLKWNVTYRLLSAVSIEDGRGSRLIMEDNCTSQVELDAPTVGIAGA